MKIIFTYLFLIAFSLQKIRILPDNYSPATDGNYFYSDIVCGGDKNKATMSHAVNMLVSELGWNFTFALNTQVYYLALVSS